MADHPSLFEALLGHGAILGPTLRVFRPCKEGGKV